MSDLNDGTYKMMTQCKMVKDGVELQATNIWKKEELRERWQEMTESEREEYLASHSATKYRPEYCQMLIDHMSNGMSYESFAAEVNVGITCIIGWEEIFPEWWDAKRHSYAKCLKYWEKILIDATSDKLKSNASLLIFKLKNTFPELYKDKMEINSTISGTVFHFDTGIQRDALTVETKDYREISESSDLL